MAARRFLVITLLYLAVSSITGGSPHNRGPPDQVDENDPQDVNLSDGPPDQVDENDPQDVNLFDDEILLGDMVLPRHRYTSYDKRVKRQAFDDDDYEWPKSGDTVTIPYTRSGVDSEVLQRAIEVFNAKTCIRFVPRGSQSNYVAFQSGSGCHAAVGYQGNGKQSCYLSGSCAGKKGKVLHEMMHILDFLHEQCRPDRNNYITIHKDNIKPGAEANFEIFPGKDLGIPYDCDSILHYKGTAFAKSPSSVTISSSRCSKLGNDDTRLSLLDYKRVNTLYRCNPNPNYRYFKVKVVTGGSYGSGTDCFIFMKLHGTQRISSEFELDLDEAGSSDLFEKDSVDTFRYMAYRDDLGPIKGISIRMVEKGWGKSWWPDSFTINDPVNKQEVKFGNTAWLKPSSTYGPSTFPKK